jgi:hypothetical protein
MGKLPFISHCGSVAARENRVRPMAAGTERACSEKQSIREPAFTWGRRFSSIDCTLDAALSIDRQSTQLDRVRSPGGRMPDAARPAHAVTALSRDIDFTPTAYKFYLDF